MEAVIIRVLLTALEPFGRSPLNSAWEACRVLVDDPPLDMDVELVVLPCVFGDAIDRLRDAVLEVEPDVVLATGQAGSRPDITVERVAINLNDSPGADNAGRQLIETTIVDDGPAAYFSSLPVKECVAAISAAGIPATESHTAGTFICNHVAYGLAHLIETERPGLVGGFVHVPFAPQQAVDREKRPSMSSATSAEALRVVLRTVAAGLGEERPAARSRPVSPPRPRSAAPAAAPRPPVRREASVVGSLLTTLATRRKRESRPTDDSMYPLY